MATQTQVVKFEDLVQKEQSLKDEMQARLDEILPAVEEAEKIRAWLAEHTPKTQNGPTAAPDSGTTPARPRRQRQGRRREEFLTIVRKHPDGIKVSDVAKEMGLSAPAYLYKLSGELRKDGVIADAPDGEGIVAA